MTIVEFFDKDAIENIISSLLCNPDKVVFVGDSTKTMKKSIERYDRVLKARGKNIEFDTISVDRSNLEKIFQALTKQLEKSGEITIDLTGGEDLFLVAAGMLYSDNPTKVQLHRFNIGNGQMYDCDADGNVLASSSENMDLTVEENVSIYGGYIVYESDKTIVTEPWDFNEEFVSDVNAMWEICCDDPKIWNSAVTHFASESEDKDDLHLHVKSDEQVLRIVDRLKETGLISEEYTLNDELHFKCKDVQIKRCLTKAGQVLELLTTLSVLSVRDENGSRQIDVLPGAVIGWDDNLEDESNVVNEIDVAVMSGLVPVFISCKNGKIEDELYKIETVAKRFGGKYARKALVATVKAGTLMYRAEELGIEIIDNIGESGFIDKEKIKGILE